MWPRQAKSKVTNRVGLHWFWGYSQPPYNRETPVAKSYAWPTLVNKTGEQLEEHYRKALKSLAKTDGMLGAIFHKAENKIPDPAKLSRIIKMIDEENWISLDADTKGDLYPDLKPSTLLAIG